MLSLKHVPGVNGSQLLEQKLQILALPTETNATLPQQQLHCNSGEVFSMWSMLGCYKQDKSVSE
jgi:hypothetical protein